MALALARIVPSIHPTLYTNAKTTLELGDRGHTHRVLVRLGLGFLCRENKTAYTSHQRRITSRLLSPGVLWRSERMNPP